jgi:hypothetical protein
MARNRGGSVLISWEAMGGKDGNKRENLNTAAMSSNPYKDKTYEYLGFIRTYTG